MDHRQLVRTLAAGRVAIGATLVLLPAAAGAWIGPVARNRGVKVMTRAAGARDLAIGLGTLHALSEGDPARSWVLAGAASDAVDLAATVLAVRQIGLRRAIPLVVVAATAAIASVAAADQID